MTYQVPTDEPAQLRAGDTWQWRRENLTDFPASAWTLTYRFKNATGGFEVSATADGDNFAVDVDSATTAAFVAGDYAWQAQVANTVTGEKYTVESGEFTVLPGFFADTASTALDTRTVAKKTLDAIDAYLQGRASADQKEYEINTGDGVSRRLVHSSWPQLLAARTYYANLVASEEAQERAAAGQPDKRRTYVRFRCGV